MLQDEELSPAALQAHLDREVADSLFKGGLILAGLGLAGGLGALISILQGLGTGLWIPCTFAFCAAGYSVVIALLARAGLMRGWLLYAILLPSLPMPTYFFLLAHVSLPAGAATYLNGPFSYVYFILIVTTGFTYRPGISLLAGLLSAAGYEAAYLISQDFLANIQAPDPTMRQELVVHQIYAQKAMIMLFASMAVAAYTWRAKRLIFRTVREERRKDRACHLFGQYVSDEVKDRLMAASAEVVGERKQVVILFSDIRGFSTMSEQLEPEEIVTRLNAYFDEMVNAIHREGGVVDKFIGDAVMAVFGGVLDLPEPAAASVRAARGMRARLAALSARWAAAGIPPFSNGVGLHLGTVLQGPIGSANRKEFTVIGDAVNTAARIEGLTKEYDYNILLTEALRASLPAQLQAACSELGAVQVKGKTEELVLFGLPDED